jgi:hypothetical protein
MSNGETIRVEQNGFAPQYSSPMSVQDETGQLFYHSEEVLTFQPLNGEPIQLGEQQALFTEIKMEENML